MISFVPESLKTDLAEAIEKLAFIDGDIEGIEFGAFENLDEMINEYDCEINEDSIVYLNLGGDDGPVLSVSEFLKMVQCLPNSRINDVQSYARTDNEVYFLLEFNDASTFELVSNTFKEDYLPETVLEHTAVLDGIKYTIGLFRGVCIYHLLVKESGNYTKYFPSYSSYDLFIKVHSDEKNISQRVADELASAYAFEIQSSFDLNLPFSSGRIDEEYIDYTTDSLRDRETQMFPLIHGKGAAELLNLYNIAKNTGDIDFKILGYTKVIEYIAPTIAQKELNEKVSLKLTSPDVFTPTAAYISELGLIYEKHRNTTTKDSELIKLSIKTAVNVDDLWDFIPAFLRGTQEKPTNEADSLSLLDKISESIYSTRNEIAHAKANYVKRSTECPFKEKDAFWKMLEKAAIRCIRWFALQPEDKRVVPYEK